MPIIMQRFTLQSVCGTTHTFNVSVETIENGIELVAQYEDGSLMLSPRTEFARWPVEVLLPAGSDPGHVWIGNGRIDISVPELRGLRLGSLFMSILIAYIRKRPNLPVVPIDLSADDATTPEARNRRNRFYERLGFNFEYQGNREWGISRPIMSHDLSCADFVPGHGWNLLKK
ncbi:hypothetical protein [Rhizobacter sp. P5_C2]